MVNHIRVRRMWRYTHQYIELTMEEHVHVMSCESCLNLFRLCMRAQDPAVAIGDEVITDGDDEQNLKKAA